MNPDPHPNPDPNPNNLNNLLETIILLGYNVRIGCASAHKTEQIYELFKINNDINKLYGKIKRKKLLKFAWKTYSKG